MSRKQFAMTEAERPLAVPVVGRPTSAALPYVEALVVVVVCTLVRAFSDPVLRDGQQFMPFAFSVVLVSLRGRVGPAVFALVTSFVASWYLFSPPRGTLLVVSVGQGLSHAIYLLLGCGVLYAITAMQQGRMRLDAMAADLRSHASRLEAEARLRNALEAELVASREQFRSLALQAPVGIIQGDERSICTFVNPAWCEIAGMSTDDVIGRSLPTLVHVDDVRETSAGWDEAVAARRVYRHTARLRRTDGRECSIMAATLPLFDPSDTYRGSISAVVDITDFQRTRESLHRNEAFLRRLLEEQERERRFLCHEFHDGPIQYAVGGHMLLEKLVDRFASCPEAEMLDSALTLVTRCIDDGRRVIRGIRPQALDDLGLVAAIDDLSEGPQQVPRVVVETVGDIDALVDPVRITIYRVCQEAISNARRHAAATAVHVRVARGSDDVTLTVRDDGRGFVPGSVPPGGCGITGMVERVRIVGGTCRITSAVGAGTTVSVMLPVGEPVRTDTPRRR